MMATSIEANKTTVIALSKGDRLSIMGEGAWSYYAFDASGLQLDSGSYADPDVIGPFSESGTVNLTASAGSSLSYDTLQASVGNATIDSSGGIVGPNGVVMSGAEVAGARAASKSVTTFTTSSDPNSATDRIVSYTDTARISFGYEYFSDLYAAHRTSPSVAKSVLLSGDSTTVGNNVQNSAYIPSTLLANMAKARGLLLSVSASAVSGKSSSDWLQTYLPADLAGTPPSVYVPKWGLNDPYPSYSLSPEQTISNIRAGLAIIRGNSSWAAAKTVIVLMTPNASSDTTNGRDEAWHEKIAAGYRQAARDFGAAFVDSYALARTARNTIQVGAGKWLDAALVHPNDDHTALLYGEVLDLIYPRPLQEMIARRVDVTPGTGFSHPNSSENLGTYLSSGAVHFTGYLGCSKSLSAGETIATIADQHRPVNGAYMVQACGWTGLTATSSANWIRFNVLIDTNGNIKTMESVGSSIARIYLFGACLSRL